MYLTAAIAAEVAPHRPKNAQRGVRRQVARGLSPQVVRFASTSTLHATLHTVSLQTLVSLPAHARSKECLLLSCSNPEDARRSTRPYRCLEPRGQSYLAATESSLDTVACLHKQATPIMPHTMAPINQDSITTHPVIRTLRMHCVCRLNYWTEG